MKQCRWAQPVRGDSGMPLQVGRRLQVEFLSDAAAQLGADLREVLHGALLQERRGGGQVAGEVVGQALALLRGEDLAVEHGGLAEVVFVAAAVAVDVAGHLLWRVQLAGARALLRAAERVRVVVRGTALVVVEAHEAVALVVLRRDAERAVDRQLQMVRAQAVAMGVSVREEAT